MKPYKNAKSYLKAIRKLADSQEVAHMRGFYKLPKEAQDMLYLLIAGIQNDIAEIEHILNDSISSDCGSKRIEP